MPYEGKSVFIAECKFWKGEKSFLATLDQVLSYLNWRGTEANQVEELRVVSKLRWLHLIF